MHMYNCPNKCCLIKIRKYDTTEGFVRRVNNYRKAGVFIYDPGKDRVLLVQSRGHLWGPPKGTMEIGETEKECAVREVYEETGVELQDQQLIKFTTIRDKATFFYIEQKSYDVDIQHHINSVEKNDANGITWIKMKCLEECILNGNIVLNYYAKIVFNRFKKKKFKSKSWILVRNKKKT